MKKKGDGSGRREEEEGGIRRIGETTWKERQKRGE